MESISLYRATPCCLSVRHADRFALGYSFTYSSSSVVFADLGLQTVLNAVRGAVYVALIPRGQWSKATKHKMIYFFAAKKVFNCTEKHRIVCQSIWPSIMTCLFASWLIG